MDEGIDLSFRPDVDASGGLVQDQHARLRLQDLGERELLLIAAGEGSGGGVGAARADVVVSHRPPQCLTLALEPQEGPCVAPQRHEREVGGEAQAGVETLSLAILAQVDDAVAHPIGRMPQTQGPAVQLEAPARSRAQAQDALEELGPTRADQAREAQDLTAVHVESDVVRPPRHAHVSHAPEHGVVARGVLLGEHVRHLAAHHQVRQAVLRGVRHVDGVDDVAVAQHRDAIRDRQHLLELVADVEDGDAAVMEVADEGEQPFDLGGRQAGGGLVHDQQAGVARERLGDLQQLLLGHDQVSHPGAGVELEPDPAEQAQGRGPHRGLVEERSPSPLTPEEDVVRDR